MSSGENIKNALNVMYKSYDNIQKLIDYCRTLTYEDTHYEMSVNRFLRRKSDNDSDAWLLNDFIILFQNSDSPDCQSENGWKNDSVYVMEICLGERNSENLPKIYLSKFEYENIDSWSEGCSPANHWVFFYPLRNKDLLNFKSYETYNIGIPRDSKSANTYWGLKKVITRSIDLMSLTSDNIKELIFGEFDRLAKM